eukprot:TRINITY_DN2221_c0_g1_i1.p1 TRINITY_DN2221_c0_g1~~TRINITY_DN2221_c0_g1_i1.p1  ORF type:complete len:320 (+),score=95.68 TRINITY_DN2221_c0_g1_i1:324-1283(+)
MRKSRRNQQSEQKVCWKVSGQKARLSVKRLLKRMKRKTQRAVKFIGDKAKLARETARKQANQLRLARWTARHARLQNRIDALEDKVENARNTRTKKYYQRRLKREKQRLFTAAGQMKRLKAMVDKVTEKQEEAKERAAEMTRQKQRKLQEKKEARADRKEELEEQKSKRAEKLSALTGRMDEAKSDLEKQNERLEKMQDKRDSVKLKLQSSRTGAKGNDRLREKVNDLEQSRRDTMRRISLLKKRIAVFAASIKLLQMKNKECHALDGRECSSRKDCFWKEAERFCVSKRNRDKRDQEKLKDAMVKMKKEKVPTAWPLV